jgi:hypothetical protein
VFAHNDHEHHKNNHDHERDKSHKTYRAQEWEKKTPQTPQVLDYN